MYRKKNTMQQWCAHHLMKWFHRNAAVAFIILPGHKHTRHSAFAVIPHIDAQRHLHFSLHPYRISRNHYDSPAERDK